MARPLGTSAQTMNSAPILLIDMQTEEIVGHAYLFCYTRMAPGLVATVLADIAGALHGERIAPIDFSSRLLQRYRLLGAQGIIRMALAGFDVACWDALSLAAGMPLASYIGSQPRPIPAYNSNGLGLMLPEAAADEAEALLDHGFRAVKLRLGRPTAEADLAVVRAVRRRLPDGVALMADYNQGLTVTEAIQRGQALGRRRPVLDRGTHAPRRLRRLCTDRRRAEDAGADRRELRRRTGHGYRAGGKSVRLRHARPGTDRRRDGLATGSGTGLGGGDRDVFAHLPRGQRASARRHADLPLAGICRLGCADPRGAAAHLGRHGAGARSAGLRRVLGRGRCQTLSHHMRLS